MTALGSLQGKRVLVTRPAHQVAAFNQLLQAQGAVAVAVPVIEIVPPDSWQPLDQALANWAQYQYIVLTSINAVAAVYARLQHLEQMSGASGGDNLSVAAVFASPSLRWVCVGSKTAQALEKLGRKPDLQPEVYRAEAVIALLLQCGVNGKHVLYPRAQIARELIPQQLQAAGASVDAPLAYNTVPATEGGAHIYQLLHQHQLDVVTFTSSSSVENFVNLLGDENISLLAGVVLASIGPLTTATAQRLGLHIAVEAQDYTLEGLVQALIDHYVLGS